MEGLYNEHVNMSGSGGSAGHFGGGIIPIFGGGSGFGGFGGFGGTSGLLELIIASRLFDGFDRGHGHHGYGYDYGRDRGRCDRDLVTKDDLIAQTLGSLKGKINNNKADILAAIIDGKCDVKDSITALQGVLSGEFRDIAGKLCDFRHDSVLQSFQTRVDIKDTKCDLERQIDKSKDAVQANIRDLRDDINDKFCKLREGQLKDELDSLRERLNRERTVNDLFDKLADDRHRRRGNDCDWGWPRRWPTASVPAEVQAPLVAFANSDPCDAIGTSALSKGK